MSTLNNQWLEIFRAGNYGAKGTYSVADLQGMAASYDPAREEAPICIGHPTHNAPAFGSIAALKVEGDVLLGMPKDVPPVIDAAVQARAYPKRSVALIRKPDGTLKLRHLGFLGAMPPEVRGLRDAQFGQEQFDEFEFSLGPKGEEMDEAQVKKTVTDSITEFFANMFGSKSPAATTTITQADVDRAAAAAATQATAAVSAQFAAELKTERDARAALEVRFSATTTEGRVATLISGLKERKHWLPAYDRMGVPQLFAELAAHSGTVTFAQGDKQITEAPVQLFADILDGLGQIVPQGVTFSEGTLKPAAVPAKLPNGNGVEIDAASITFNAEVTAYAAEKNITFNQAFDALTAQGKRPQVGAAAAGAV